MTAQTMVEPFASAQYYLVWHGACTDPDVYDGDTVFYKYVKSGFFSKNLYVWTGDPDNGFWELSSRKKVPKNNAYQRKVFKIKKHDREDLYQEYLRELEEEMMSPEDIACREDIRRIKAEAAIRQRRMMEKAQKEFFQNDRTSQLLDAYLARNKKRRDLES